MSQLEFFGGASPFDQIRKVDAIGNEFWTARSLMPLLGYPRWKEFSAVVDRAKLACANIGGCVEDHFSHALHKSSDQDDYCDYYDLGSIPTSNNNNKPNPAKGRPGLDFHMTRYGCYLVAMNGDPRKVEVAAAQSYFAIKTHEAETASTEAEMPNIIERQIELERIKLERDKIALEREKLAITAKTPRPSAVKQPAKLTEPSYKEMQVIGYLKEHGSISDRQLVQKHWANTCAEARRLLIALSNKGFGRVKRLGRVSMGLEASA